MSTAVLEGFTAFAETYMFNPLQARVPAHVSEHGGEWIDTGRGLLKDFLDRWDKVPPDAPVVMQTTAPKPPRRTDPHWVEKVQAQENLDQLAIEGQAIGYYTADQVHYQLSEELRHTDEEIPVTLPKWDPSQGPDPTGESIVSILDSAIHRFKAAKPARLFRGLAVPPGFEWHPGDLVTDKSYVSLTDEPQLAAEFALLRSGLPSSLSGQETRPPIQGQPAIVEVAVPKGTNLAPGSPSVFEWILPRNTVFKVIAVEETTSPVGPVKQVLMEVVP